MSQDASPGNVPSIGPTVDVGGKSDVQDVEAISIKHHALDILAAADFLIERRHFLSSEVPSLQQLRELEEKYRRLQEALSCASLYIATIQNRFHSIISQDKMLEGLYSVWVASSQNCRVSSTDSKTPAFMSSMLPTPTMMTETAAKMLASTFDPSVSALDTSDMQQHDRKKVRPSMNIITTSNVLRDCLIIQTDGVTEALDDDTLHKYAAEVRLLREKAIILQEEFTREQEMRLATDKLNAVLRAEISSQQDAIKEAAEENEKLHEQIRLLKEKLYEIEASADISRDETWKLNEKLNQFQGCLSEIRLQFKGMLSVFGKEPGSQRPTRPVSASASAGGRRGGALYDVNLSSIMEDAKQVHSLILAMREGAAAQAQTEPATGVSTQGQQALVKTLMVDGTAQTDEAITVSEEPSTGSLPLCSVMQQSTRADDTVTPVTNTDIAQFMMQSTGAPGILSSEAVLQRLQEHAAMEQKLAISLSETQTAQKRMEDALAKQAAAEQNAAKYQDSLARLEAELKRTNYVLHNLMESIVAFDVVSELPILDTAISAQNYVSEDDPMPTTLRVESSAYSKGSLGMIRRFQERVETLELEQEKLRTSNLMFLKREACNINTIRQLEKQMRRLSEENSVLANENALLLTGRSSADPETGALAIASENKALREQLATVQSHFTQLKSEHDKLVSSYKSLSIEINGERTRRFRAEDRCTIMKDELQEANEDRRSQSGSRISSRRSSVSGRSSINVAREDPGVMRDVVSGLKRTIATIRLENINLAGHIDTLLQNERKAKQCIAQLMLENNKLLADAVCRENLIYNIQRASQRYLQTLMRLSAATVPSKAHDALLDSVVKLEERVSTQTTELSLSYEECVKLQTSNAKLSTDNARLADENIRLSSENDRLVRAPDGMPGLSGTTHPFIFSNKNAPGAHETLAIALSQVQQTPDHTLEQSDNRLRFTLAKAEIVLSQQISGHGTSIESEFLKFSDSLDRLALQNKHLQHENAQIKQRIRYYETQHFVPHDALLRMARYLNEKKEELLTTMEIAQNHNSKLKSLHNYAVQLRNEYLPTVDNRSAEEDMNESEHLNVTTLQIKQALRKLIKEVVSVEPLECNISVLQLATTPEILQRFTSHR